MQNLCARIGLCLLGVGGISGCAAYDGLCLFHCGSTHAGSTPLVAYLYPDGDIPKADATPVLKVPLTVGITFLPDRSGEAGVEPRDKELILARLRDRFRSLDYVRDIVIVPDYYLAPSGQAPLRGFEALAQLARIQNLDVVALVSYDQVAKRDENARSLAYLTIIGAYAVRGSHSETSTLLDLAVVEPETRSLLVRAGGTGFSSGSSTAIDLDEKLRRQSRRGLDQASDQLITQLDHELALFSERVKSGDGPIRVVKRGATGEGGGGGVGGWTLPWLLILAGLPLVSRRCRCGSAHP